MGREGKGRKDGDVPVWMYMHVHGDAVSGAGGEKRRGVRAVFR